MKTEIVEPTDEQVIELAKNQEMKSLMDGTSSPLVNDQVPKDPEPEIKEDEEPAAQDDDANKESEKVEPTLEERLQAALERVQKLERALDKTNGTYGNELNHLRRKVAEVESRKPEQRQFNLTAAQLKRISDQYPELADALANDLTEAFGANVETKQQETSKPEPQNDPRVDELSESTNRMADQLKQIALNELSKVHGDWRDVARWWEKDIPGVGKTIQWANPKFAEWLNDQDDDIQDVVYKSDDISAIANVITKFKESIAPKKEPENPEIAEIVSKGKEINKKLEKAVLPTGRRTGSHELLTDDEVIQQAMREEQKRIMNGY